MDESIYVCRNCRRDVKLRVGDDIGIRAWWDGDTYYIAVYMIILEVNKVIPLYVMGFEIC